MTSSSNIPDLPRILGLSIDIASRALCKGHITSVNLVKAYLNRIEETSDFNAVLQLNPDALIDARILDEERVQSGSRGVLHGIPILVKDSIATTDKLDVSSGSFALFGAKPRNESSLISRLRAAGVVILGKTNLSEWANFRGLEIAPGWSPRGGQTFGAYHPNSSPDGSSAGSAVAVALGLCTAALGTETFGSILDPAELNNVVGFKPTRGLIANDGVIPISKRQDVIGTMTTTVRDAAHMLTAMAGRSNLDNRTWSIPFSPIPNFAASCQDTSLNGIRIGVPRNSFGANLSIPIMTLFENALRMLNSTQAQVVDNADIPTAEEFKKLNHQAKDVVLLSEFKRDIVEYLQTLETNPNAIQSAEDIIEFTKRHPAEKYPERDIRRLLRTQAEGVNVNSAQYAETIQQELCLAGEGGILGAMRKYNVDVLVVPSTLGIATEMAAKMGFPVISVPLGFWPENTPIERDVRVGGLIKRAPGLPFCLTFVGKAFSDGELLQVAHAFEQVSAVRENGPLPFKLPQTELKDIQ